MTRTEIVKQRRHLIVTIKTREIAHINISVVEQWCYQMCGESYCYWELEWDGFMQGQPDHMLKSFWVMSWYYFTGRRRRRLLGSWWCVLTRSTGLTAIIIYCYDKFKCIFTVLHFMWLTAKVWHLGKCTRLLSGGELLQLASV